ncbi:unspecified product [Leishmania tarentolae]|uniref:Unspecified product n=1 Tax=Leishmania tarentolae TaxID=5689 RepID=A0A640KFH6_LEITA|nr:unspecified product [Leishmania tarentolae]
MYPVPALSQRGSLPRFYEASARKPVLVQLRPGVLSTLYLKDNAVSTSDEASSVRRHQFKAVRLSRTDTSELQLSTGKSMKSETGYEEGVCANV